MPARQCHIEMPQETRNLTESDNFAVMPRGSVPTTSQSSFDGKRKTVLLDLNKKRLSPDKSLQALRVRPFTNDAKHRDEDDIKEFYDLNYGRYPTPKVYLKALARQKKKAADECRYFGNFSELAAIPNGGNGVGPGNASVMSYAAGLRNYKIVRAPGITSTNSLNNNFLSSAQ
jgi:hypothetical protein